MVANQGQVGIRGCPARLVANAMTIKLGQAPNVGGTILLRDYSGRVETTDRLPKHDLQPVLYGLFGEVGSIMTAAKKYYRESEAYTGYRAALEEDFGDTMWYLAALCRRLGVSLDQAFMNLSGGPEIAVAATDLNIGPVASVPTTKVNSELGTALLQLGIATATLLSLPSDAEEALAKVQTFVEVYVRALQAVGLSFARILRLNIEKVEGRFLPAGQQRLPEFDLTFPEDERI